MRYSLAALLCIASFGFAHASGQAAEPIPPEFENAPAVVLKETKTWNVVPNRYADFNVFERVLIQDPRGFTEADRAIVYDSKRTKIEDFSARTIQPDGPTIVVPQELIHDVVLFKTEEVEYRSRQFTFLSVRPGSVLELKYRIHEKEPSMARVWEPQRSIPVMHSSFSITVKQPAHIVPLYIFPVGRGVGGDSCELKDNRESARSKKYAMTCRDLPALELDRQSPPERDVRIRLDAIWGATKQVVVSWRRMALAWSTSIDRFAQQCVSCRKLGSNLARGATGDGEKVDRVVEWVKRNLEFRPAPFAPGRGGPTLHYSSAEEVLENGGGWPHEITLFTMALLRGAGVSAYPILVADRSEGRFLYDAMDSARHLMLVATIDGAKSVVDPSCRYCEPGTTDWRYAADKGYAGVLLAGALGTPVAVGTIPAAHNALRRAERVELAEDGVASITGEARWSGQFSVDQRERWAEMSDVARREDFLGSLAGAIDDPHLELSDPEDVFETLTARYAFESDAILLPDKRMLIRPLNVFSERLPVPIQETRDSPLWFRFPFSIESETTFKLPAGYRARLPEEPVTLSGPGMSFRSGWKSGRHVGEVVWRASLIVKEVEVATEDYDEARGFARKLGHLLRGGIVADRSADRASETLE